jgi:F-type H+-transporting ATPase subunit b
MTFMNALILAAAAEGEKGGYDHWWQDTNIWVLVPVLIVLALFWRFGVHKKIAEALDNRSSKIADELEAARNLREEAQELLAKYQRRQREAEEEAQGIINQAKRDAKRMSEEMREKLDEQLERRTKAAEEKIARAEAQALMEVRNQTADVAVAAAEEIIKSRVEGPAQGSLIDKAISDVRSRLN